jgi:hypothetical protein
MSRRRSADLLHRIEFGEGGNDAGYLGIGWSTDEVGHRWTEGGVSEIWLEHPGPARAVRVELDLLPLLYPPALTEQRLRVRVRNVMIYRARLTAEGVHGFIIPAALLAAPGPVRIALEHPGFRAPAEFEGDDGRKLAFAVRSLTLFAADDVPDRKHAEMTVEELESSTGMDAADFIALFENLGDDCEFGFVQRQCNAEPLGLLRFAFLEPWDLLRALRTRFEGMGALENLRHFLVEGEYIIRDTGSGLAYHTWQMQGSVDEAALLPQHAAHVAFLVRRLVRQLSDASRIFVWKRAGDAAEAEAGALHQALRAYGPNTLLWVAKADEGHAAGTVQRIGPGLLRGNLDRFAPAYDADELFLEQWLRVCAGAWREKEAVLF